MILASNSSFPDCPSLNGLSAFQPGSRGGPCSQPQSRSNLQSLAVLVQKRGIGFPSKSLPYHPKSTMKVEIVCLLCKHSLSVALCPLYQLIPQVPPMVEPGLSEDSTTKSLILSPLFLSGKLGAF
jgi:hypothetical protein